MGKLQTKDAGQVKINPSFEESDVVLTSYLYKKKLKKSALASSAWKYRFCVLRNSGRLFYYPNPASTTPLGFMDTYAVQVINDTGDEKIACWDIVGPGIGYRFASDTLALKEQWIAAFRSFAPTSRQSVNPSSNLPSATTSGAVDLRAEGMNELVSTEKAYLQNLYSTIELYKNSEDLTDMVGLAETYVLFANIEILSQVNRLLLAMLEKEHKLPPEKQNVGRVFLDMVMPMKVYITYFTNYPQACQRLQELKNTKSGLSDFLERTRLHPDSNLQDLNSMLIKPIQRISKYPLLLRELLKHTPDTHTHYSELKQAVEQIEELLNLLNDKQRDSEALARLARIHSSLIWKDQQPVQLVMPTRKLLRKQKFSRIYREEHINKAAPGLMMLFNDLLIVTKKRGLKRHRCLSAIPLRCLILWEDPANAAAVVVVNKEIRPHVKHTVITGSVAEKEEWTELILATVGEVMATQSCGTLLFRPSRPLLKGSS